MLSRIFRCQSHSKWAFSASSLVPRYSALCGYRARDLEKVFVLELEGLDRDSKRPRFPDCVQMQPLKLRHCLQELGLGGFGWFAQGVGGRF